MRNSKKARSSTQKKYEMLSARIYDFDVFCASGINPCLDIGRGGVPDPDAKVYKFSTSIEIAGVFLGPEERVNEPLRLTVYGEEFKEGEFSLRVKDFHALDDDLQPVYKKKKDRLMPVYRPPIGLGLLNQVRGKKEWEGWTRVDPGVAITMLDLLSCMEKLYLSVTEIKVDRTRWIHRLCLQTECPDEE